MKPPYRVQEYILDMGAYHKKWIIDGVSCEEYNKRNVYRSGFYVILPSDDIFGEKLPQTVCGEDERVKLVRRYEER